MPGVHALAWRITGIRDSGGIVVLSRFEFNGLSKTESLPVYSLGSFGIEDLREAVGDAVLEIRIGLDLQVESCVPEIKDTTEDACGARASRTRFDHEFLGIVRGKVDEFDLVDGGMMMIAEQKAGIRGPTGGLFDQTDQ
ncbi:MAG: hypothetical protein QM757_39405 [Paludibaculum sp.]